MTDRREAASTLRRVIFSHRAAETRKEFKNPRMRAFRNRRVTEVREYKGSGFSNFPFLDSWICSAFRGSVATSGLLRSVNATECPPEHVLVAAVAWLCYFLPNSGALCREAIECPTKL